MKADLVVNKKVCLVVIDGWGLSVDGQHLDSIKDAKTPIMDDLCTNYPMVPLAAHGLHVGLPDGLMGNSEVGHLNIGAGRVVYQDIVRIEMAIKNREWYNDPNIQAMVEHCKKNNKPVHLIGLVSDGGVQSQLDHLKSLLLLCKDFGVPKAIVHAITDGRDVGPRTALKYLKDLQSFISSIGYGQIASVVGRYYAMDRDKRWERTEAAFDLFTAGKGNKYSSLDEVVETNYSLEINDEFFTPSILPDYEPIVNGSGVLFFNFRSDRMRQIVASFLGMTEIKKTKLEIMLLSMTKYNDSFDIPVLSPPQTLDNVLAEWLSKTSVPQCHIAETEKYAHVTFFFNGGREEAFKGESRVLVPSPKVSTYDLKPEMSVHQVAEKVCEAISSGEFGLVICNLAPPDMVGHTGKYEETKAAVEATDLAISNIWETCKKNNWTLFVTADHGNAEVMTKDGQPHTAHTCSPVPFICGDRTFKFKTPTRPPALCDVAPTILTAMGLPTPKEMTGQSLL